MLLTRAPLYRGRNPFSGDLHVLSAPLTFVLSQDQTLQLNLEAPNRLKVRGDSCSEEHDVTLEVADRSAPHVAHVIVVGIQSSFQGPSRSCSLTPP